MQRTPVLARWAFALVLAAALTAGASSSLVQNALGRPAIVAEEPPKGNPGG